MANTYTYNNNNLSGGPTTASTLSRNGSIDDPTGLYRPGNTGNVLPSSLDVVSLKSDQVIPNFDKRFVPVWTNLLDNGAAREYVTYNGEFYVEYLEGNTALASEWEKNRQASNQTDYAVTEGENSSIVFKLNAEDSKAELTKRHLDLSALVKAYDDAEDITPIFTDMDRLIDSKRSANLLTSTLDQYNSDVELEENLALFDNNDPLTMARYYFGSSTHDDVAFYMDHRDCIRIGYDYTMLYRSRPLVEDLLKYATPDQYALGVYPNGTHTYVLQPELSQAFLRRLGGEERFALRYNRDDATPSQFDPTVFSEFEKTVDVANKRLFSSTLLFGTDDPIVKK